MRAANAILLLACADQNFLAHRVISAALSSTEPVEPSPPFGVDRWRGVASPTSIWYTPSMTKIEQLTQTASALADDQLDGLIAYAAYLAGEPLFYTAPDDVLASIERGLIEHGSGNTLVAADVLAQMRAKAASPRA